MDKSRPNREQNLADWARSQLKCPRKLSRIIDPRLEGQYSEFGAQKAAELAYQCLSHRPKARPKMSEVVKTLEPLKDYNDVPIGPFVYTAPKEEQTKTKRDSNGHNKRHDEHGQSHRTKSSLSPHVIHSDPILHRNLGVRPNSPMQQRFKRG